jgi:hypothetical protein
VFMLPLHLTTATSVLAPVRETTRERGRQRRRPLYHLAPQLITLIPLDSHEAVVTASPHERDYPDQRGLRVGGGHESIMCACNGWLVGPTWQSDAQRCVLGGGSVRLRRGIGPAAPQRGADVWVEGRKQSGPPGRFQPKRWHFFSFSDFIFCLVFPFYFKS